MRSYGTYVIQTFDPTAVDPEAGPFEGINVFKVVTSDPRHSAAEQADRIVREMSAKHPGWYFRVQPIPHKDVV